MAEFGLQYCSKEYEIRKQRPKQLKSVIVRVIGFILKPVSHFTKQEMLKDKSDHKTAAAIDNIQYQDKHCSCCHKVVNCIVVT